MPEIQSYHKHFLIHLHVNCSEEYFIYETVSIDQAYNLKNYNIDTVYIFVLHKTPVLFIYIQIDVHQQQCPKYKATINMWEQIQRI